VVRIGSTTYTLENYDFTKTNIKDKKPAVDYFAGICGGKRHTGPAPVQTAGKLPLKYREIIMDTIRFGEPLKPRF